MNTVMINSIGHFIIADRSTVIFLLRSMNTLMITLL